MLALWLPATTYMDASQPPRPRASSLYFTLAKILLPWVIAVALAFGHHAFDASLDGREVSSGYTKSALLLVHSQAGASAIGTTFAFLTSAFLAASAGAAFFNPPGGSCVSGASPSRALTRCGLRRITASRSSRSTFGGRDGEWL